MFYDLHGIEAFVENNQWMKLGLIIEGEN